MTELGVFARVFPAGLLSRSPAAAIRAAGFTATQLNWPPSAAPRSIPP